MRTEQVALDAMYTRLEQMRREALQRREDARFSSDGTPAGRFNRDALQHRYSQELAALNAAEDKLCFGRLDRDPAALAAFGPGAGGSAGSGSASAPESAPSPADEADAQRVIDEHSAEATIHIGRMGLTDGTAARRQILIDWRAPASAPFYTATALEPQGVIRRRHLQTRRRQVTGVADEYLQGDPDAQPAGGGHDDLGAAGNSALLEALNAPRTGRMQDIIATIQSEQDKIIRADRSGVLVVQGGPGTGKTVVALHRAAYLLYTHRERLGGHGVLVLGPNRTFLEYIGQVLPSLGESSVVLATIGSLYPGVEATDPDTPRAAELKGRAMMAGVVENAVLALQAMPRRTKLIEYDRGTLRLEPSLLAKAQRRAWGSRLPHNRARAVFVKAVLDGLAQQVAGRPGVKQAPEAEQQPPDLDGIRTDLAQDPDVMGALAALWPALTPQRVIGELFSDPRRLAFAAPTLSAAQRDALLRPAGSPWTVPDVPLLDEAAELLGELGAADRAAAQRRARRREDLQFAQESLDALDSAAAGQEDSGIGFTVGMLSAEDLAELHEDNPFDLSTADRAAADREWTYGHVIVDEAQELSAMAWRMVMRRVPAKSMTLVGDIAQTSDPAGATAWGKALRGFVGDRWRLAELTVNYRTPGEIMDVAARVLAKIVPELSPPESVRRTGSRPWAQRVDAAELGAAAGRAAAAELAEHDEGQLAVLVPDELGADVLAAVQAAVPGAGTDAGPHHRVSVLTVRQAKGLEFDAVVLVEPATMVQQSKRGWGDLYVALTRATQRLGIVHHRALPLQLDDLLDRR
ncbi:AAA family ATPase [Nakamurella sp. DB0629]|uniref:AAA family ATPase n=2 Tax=Nakamurella aerolata TaxID=1656892 RepID=A0A849AD09_9ACTN|nr:AAA family ATPase [Nakamurella aerolata]